MADRIRRIIEADPKPYLSALQQSSQATTRFGNTTDRALKGTQSRFRALGKQLGALASNYAALGAVAGAAAVGGLALLVRRAIDSADNIAKTADKIGIGVEALQELRFAAEQAGVEQGTLDLSLQRFTRRLGEAVQGTGELKGILEQYDIATTNADGTTRRAEDVLLDLADATRRAGDSTEQLRINFKAFDSEGAALVNLTRLGAAGMRELQAQARAVGAVLSENTIRRAEEANRELKIMEAVLRTAGTAAALEFLPFMRKVAEIFQDESFLSGIRTATNRFGDLIDLFVNNAETILKVAAALKGAAIGGRIGGLPGAAIGGAAGFFGVGALFRQGLEDLPVEQLKTKEREITESIANIRKQLADPVTGRALGITLKPELQLKLAELTAVQQELEKRERTGLTGGGGSGARSGGTGRGRPTPTPSPTATSDSIDEAEINRILARTAGFFDEGVADFPDRVELPGFGALRIEELSDQTEVAKVSAEELELVWRDIGDRIGSAGSTLLDGLVRGTLDWEDALQLVLREVSSIIQALVRADSLQSGGTGQGGTSGASIVGQVVSSVGSFIGSFFHEGGMVGPEGRRLALPSYHGGGLVQPGEALVKVMEGETIRTPEQEAALRSGIPALDRIGDVMRNIQAPNPNLAGRIEGGGGRPGNVQVAFNGPMLDPAALKMSPDEILTVVVDGYEYHAGLRDATGREISRRSGR